MKILSFNTHSLHGAKSEEEQRVSELCKIIQKESPDLIALQEVNQTASAPYADTNFTDGYYRAATCVFPVPLKKDNFLLSLAWMLNLNNVSYYYTWLPVKKGYKKYDEGLAILSKIPIRTACGVYLSRIQDYENWKTRMALVCEIEERETLFCCVHTSRYDDPDEPFSNQWKKLLETVNGKNAVISGDLNVPADIRGEGYDEILKSRFFDVYTLASQKIGYNYTVKGNIDGWSSSPQGVARRIDFILLDSPPKTDKISYYTVLDGKRGEAVSDHFGILAEIEGEINDNTEMMKRREW